MVAQNLNSYTLEKLNGTPIAGLFSARRLREFIPSEGTKLAQEQAALYQQLESDNHNGDNPQGDGEQLEERGNEDQDNDEDTGRTMGNEDTATEEGGHME